MLGTAGCSSPEGQDAQLTPLNKALHALGRGGFLQVPTLSGLGHPAQLRS